MFVTADDGTGRPCARSAYRRPVSGRAIGLATRSLCATLLFLGASLAHALETCPAPQDGRYDLPTAAAILEPGLALPAAFGLPSDLRPWSEVQPPPPPGTAGRASGGGGRGGGDAADTAEPREPSAGATRAAWRAAARAYGLEPPEVRSGAVDADWVARAAQRVQVVGLRLIDDRSGGRELAAVGVYWNSPLLPRLRLLRIAGAASDEEATALAAWRLGTCALPVDAWIDVPVTTAERLLDLSEEPFLLAFGPRAGDAQGWTAWFERDRIDEALAFEAPEVAGLPEYAAVFAGSGPSWPQLVRSLPSLRGSLGPGAILDLLRGMIFR